MKASCWDLSLRKLESRNAAQKHILGQRNGGQRGVKEKGQGKSSMIEWAGVIAPLGVCEWVGEVHAGVRGHEHWSMPDVTLLPSTHSSIYLLGLSLNRAFFQGGGP